MKVNILLNCLDHVLVVCVAVFCLAHCPVLLIVLLNLSFKMLLDNPDGLRLLSVTSN